MTFTSSGKGEYVASENHEIVTPRLPVTGSANRPLIFCHPVSGTAYTWRYLSHELQRFADMGFVVISCDLGGGVTWGNDTFIARISQALAFVKTRGAANLPPVIYGASMGGTALNWVKANTCAAYLGFLPLLDVKGVRDGNVLGYAASINTAYGGAAAFDAAAATHSPLLDAASHAADATPKRIFAQTDDPICTLAAAQAFDAAVPACDLTVIAGSHTFPPTDPVIEQMASFLAPYA